jgi:hypothetical protein
VIRRIAVVAALMLAAMAADPYTAGSTPIDVSQKNPGRNCGTIAAGGKSWLVLTINLPCPQAKTPMRKLAAKPPRGVSKTAQYPGKHLGMTCVYHHPQKGHMGQVYCLGTAPYKIATASAGLRRP